MAWWKLRSVTRKHSPMGGRRSAMKRTVPPGKQWQRRRELCAPSWNAVWFSGNHSSAIKGEPGALLLEWRQESYSGHLWLCCGSFWQAGGGTVFLPESSISYEAKLVCCVFNYLIRLSLKALLKTVLHRPPKSPSVIRLAFLGALYQCDSHLQTTRHFRSQHALAPKAVGRVDVRARLS